MNVILISLVLGQTYLPSGDYAVKPSNAYSTCQCGGSNKGVCHCLQNGIACHCTPSKGSVWNLNDKGKAVSKTGEYANPQALTVPKQASNPFVAVNRGPQFSKVCTRRGCIIIQNW